MINEIIKLLFLAILIAIGIIFVSDGFMDKINQSINDIKNYGREVWQQQAPRIQQDFATQAAETFNELKKCSKMDGKFAGIKLSAGFGIKFLKIFASSRTSTSGIFIAILPAVCGGEITVCQAPITSLLTPPYWVILLIIR